MAFEKYLKSNLLKKASADLKQVQHQLIRAQQDLATAEANLKIDPTWALTIAYHAMIRAGRALIYSKGYLPTQQQTHKTIVECTEIILGKEYRDLVLQFNRLRRRRHHFIYDSENHVDIAEAKMAIKTAKEMIRNIEALLVKVGKGK